MMDLLSRGERSVTELAEAAGASQPAASQHLRVLRETGLVKQRRDGRRRLYRLTPEPLREVAAWIEGYRPAWRDKLAAQSIPVVSPFRCQSRAQPSTNT